MISPNVGESPGPNGLRAVVFDFFGTLACHSTGVASEYPAVFAKHGYRLDRQVEARYFTRYDGVEHLEHSTDKATYEAWVHFRLSEPALACGVPPGALDHLVDDLRALDTSPVWHIETPHPPLASCATAAFALASVRTGDGSSTRTWPKPGCSNWSTRRSPQRVPAPANPTLGSSPPPPTRSVSGRKRRSSLATPSTPTWWGRSRREWSPLTCGGPRPERTPRVADPAGRGGGRIGRRLSAFVGAHHHRWSQSPEVGSSTHRSVPTRTPETRGRTIAQRGDEEDR